MTSASPSHRIGIFHKSPYAVPGGGHPFPLPKDFNASISTAFGWLTPFAIVAGILATGTAQGDPLSGAAFVAALRKGGYVLLMRHASSPPTPPTTGSAEHDNTKLERQLDETGRSSAQAMGKAIKALGIPIGEVWSSPTYRALETVRLAGLPNPTTATELSDGGQSMQATSQEQTAWLQAKVAEPGAANLVALTETNTISQTYSVHATVLMFPAQGSIVRLGLAGGIAGQTITITITNRQLAGFQGFPF